MLNEIINIFGLQKLFHICVQQWRSVSSFFKYYTKFSKDEVHQIQIY